MTDGIFNDISIEAYHADREYDSSTTIKWAKQSLAHYAYMRNSKQEDKPHFSFGNAFELALLDRVGFNKAVGVMETEMWVAEAQAEKKKEDEAKSKGKTKEFIPFVKPKSSGFYQNKEKAFIEQNAGKYHIDDVGKHSYATIEKMLESCMKDSTIQRLISGIEYQLSLFWHDDQTGLGLKTRPDISKRKNNVIVNVKTIEDGSPQSWSRELVKYDYPLQACIEMSGAVATGLMNSVDNYFWLVVEKVEPFNATIYEFSQNDIPSCMDQLEYQLNKLAKAKKENLFPGYTQEADNAHGILTASIPPWYH